jgi:tripartite-type tricarboxylate transporter receptor subunit TctC
MNAVSRTSGSVRSSRRRATMAAFALACVASLAPLFAQAQATYPSRPLKLVVPFAAGGPTDVLARVIARGMAEKLGQPVVVENRPGSSGNIGFQSVARSPADGYTLAIIDISFAVNPTLYKTPGYDPAKDFTPISMIASAPVALVVTASLPLQSVKDLIAYARENAGKATFASAGAGSPPHLFMESFAAQAGIGMSHIPYKGAAPAITDVAGGNVNAMFVGVSAALPLITSGKLRPLAVTGTRRLASLPSTPTFDEIGLPQDDLKFGPWWAIAAPAGLAPDIAERLNAAVHYAVATSEARETFTRLDILPAPNTPAALSSFMNDEVVKWGGVIRKAKITAE